jgi:hypothetical protein
MQIAYIIIPLLVGTIMTILAFFIKKTIFEKLDETNRKSDETNKSIKDLAEKFNTFEKSCIEKYVVKTDLEANAISHTGLRKDITDIRERIAKIETDIININTRRRK